MTSHLKHLFINKKLRKIILPKDFTSFLDINTTKLPVRVPYVMRHPTERSGSYRTKNGPYKGRRERYYFSSIHIRKDVKS